jgi:hypothetical protein
MNNTTATATDANAKASSVNGKQADTADEARLERMQRAEEMVDRLGEQVGRCVSSLGHSILKWVARAREEVDDIWAEAQSLRQSKWAASEQEARNQGQASGARGQQANNRDH